MDLMQAINERHSVRDFKDIPISDEDVRELEEYIAEMNRESGLHMQLILNEPKAFNSPGIRIITHYGKFRNAMNYIALIGRKSANLDEKCGYYGEHIVLKAQQMGLRTCWVGGTYRRVPSACEINEGEKIAAIIAIGYGNEDGKTHKSKSFSDVVKFKDNYPVWFVRGVEAALLAPTALDQQKFTITRSCGKIDINAIPGPFSKLDLGIVKYHFEIGSGRPL